MKTAFIVGFVLAAVACGGESRVLCYWGTWSHAYPGNGQYGVSDIDPFLCTHLFYSFIGITGDGAVDILDEDFDIGQNGFADFVALKNKNPDLVVMAAIGGWNQGSENFSAVVTDTELRNKFVENVVTFLDLYKFDGLDLDWEYPGQRGGLETDKENFVLLCQELRAVFDPRGWLLSAAVPAMETSFTISYDVPAINKLLHFINLMTYDFHGSWDDVTGVVAPLFPQLSDDADTLLTVNASVHAWINAGASPENLNVGLALYGRSFTLSNTTERSTGAPVDGAGVAGPYSEEAGVWTFQEICESIKNNTEEWKVTVVPGNYAYASRDEFWIGFDSPTTIHAKAKFARDLKLGGIMFWSINYDDFRGFCGRVHPLINAAKKGYLGVY